MRTRRKTKRHIATDEQRNAEFVASCANEDVADVQENHGNIIAQGRARQVQQLFRHSQYLEEAGFKPTRDMSLTRADFHSAHNVGRFRDENAQILTLTESLTALWRDPNAFDDRLGKWGNIKGFRSWFARPPIVELQRMTALLVESATEAIYSVLTSDDPRLATAKVQAARTAFEIAGVGGTKRQEIQILDKEVSQMTREEKLQLIAEARNMQEEDEE